jgi:hypothetical protein
VSRPFPSSSSSSSYHSRRFCRFVIVVGSGARGGVLYNRSLQSCISSRANRKDARGDRERAVTACRKIPRPRREFAHSRSRARLVDRTRHGHRSKFRRHDQGCAEEGRAEEEAGRREEEDPGQEDRRRRPRQGDRETASRRPRWSRARRRDGRRRRVAARPLPRRQSRTQSGRRRRRREARRVEPSLQRHERGRQGPYRATTRLIRSRARAINS